MGQTFTYTYGAHTLTYKVTSEGAGGNTVQVGDDSYGGGHPAKPTGAVTIPQTVSFGSSNFTVTAISGRAFYLCEDITSVVLPPTIRFLGPESFCSCTSLSDISLPESLETIESWAFAHCKSITSIRIPASLTNLSAAFINCTSLGAFTVAPDSSSFCSVDGVLYDKSVAKLVAYPAAKLENYVMPSTVTTIQFEAFSSFPIETLNIPSTVTSIDTYIFFMARSRTITLGTGITDIPVGTFCECAFLTSVAAYGNIDSIDTTEPTFRLINKDNVSISLPTGLVGGRSLAERQQTWRDAGFTNFSTTPNKVVTFNTQGGSTAPNGQVVTPGAKASQPANPTRSGYTFGGWFTTAACTGNAWNFASATVTESVTLYAKWTPNVYTVTFDTQGGSTVESIQVSYLETVSKPADPTRPGYEFAGWLWDDDDNVNTPMVAWDFATTTMPDADVTLVAKWTLLMRASVPLSPAATAHVSDSSVTFTEGCALVSKTPVALTVSRIGLTLLSGTTGALPGDGARSVSLSVNNLPLTIPTTSDPAWTTAGFAVPAALWDPAANDGAGAWTGGSLPLAFAMELAPGQKLTSTSSPIDFATVTFVIEGAGA